MIKKIESLREKYGPFVESTFKRLIEGDPSDNFKYTEFLLRTWSKRNTNNCPSNTLDLIKYIHAFDALLPYIEVQDRDIYSKKYYDIENLEHVIISAEEKKEESTFNREEHCEVYVENDEYIFLSPKTFRGSMKYGANTKWCTASKKNPATFDRYKNDGFLCYLINKNNNINGLSNKVAIYCDLRVNPYSGGDLMIFNIRDVQVNETIMIKDGWDEDELFKIFMIYRRIFAEKKKYKNSKEYVSKFIKKIDSLDFDEFNNHVKSLTNGQDINFIDSITNKFKIINEKIKQLDYGY